MEVTIGAVTVALNRYDAAEVLSRLPLFVERVCGYDRENFVEEWRELWTGNCYSTESIPPITSDNIDVTVTNY